MNTSGVTLKPNSDMVRNSGYLTSLSEIGSNVQGLETTASYDKATQEFVIHTPVLTASKWWIGSLGRTYLSIRRSINPPEQIMHVLWPN
jgi:hypothetical protein